MKRFTIMGFTEAELGFVLAALFIAVAVAAVRERDANAAGIAAQQGVVDSLRHEVAALGDSTRQLRDSITVLEEKISTKVPQCWERGEQSAAIADLDVLGANRYALNGDTLTIDGVRAELAAFIERAEALDCRFVVRARPTSGIDAVQQSAAVWQLRR
ncbi:MAG: hypothetical protein ACREKM_07265, partial [Longimicrobiales bacterium]